MPKLDIQNLSKLQAAGLINPNSGLAGLQVGTGQVRTPQMASPVQLQFIEKDTSLPTKMGGAVANVFDAIQAKAIADATAQGKLNGQGAADAHHRSWLKKYYGDGQNPGVIAETGQNFIDKSREWQAGYEESTKQMAGSMEPYSASAFVKHSMTLRKSEFDRVNVNVKDAQLKVNEATHKSVNDSSIGTLASRINDRIRNIPSGTTDEGAFNAWMAPTQTWMAEEIMRRDELMGLPPGTSKDAVLYETAVSMASTIQKQDLLLFQSIASSFYTGIDDPELKEKVANLPSDQINRWMKADVQELEIKDLKEKQTAKANEEFYLRGINATTNPIEAQRFIAVAMSIGANKHELAYVQQLANVKYNETFDPASSRVIEQASLDNLPPDDLVKLAAKEGVALTVAQQTAYTASKATNLTERINLGADRIKAFVVAGQSAPEGLSEKMVNDYLGRVSKSTAVATLHNEWRQYAPKALQSLSLDEAYETFMRTKAPKILMDDATVRLDPKASSIPSHVSWYKEVHAASQDALNPYSKMVEAMAAKSPDIKDAMEHGATGSKSQYEILKWLAKEIESEASPARSKLGEVQPLNPRRLQLTQAFSGIYAKVTRDTIKRLNGSISADWSAEVNLAAVTLYQNAEQGLQDAVDKKLKADKAASTAKDTK